MILYKYYIERLSNYTKEKHLISYFVLKLNNNFLIYIDLYNIYYKNNNIYIRGSEITNLEYLKLCKKITLNVNYIFKYLNIKKLNNNTSLYVYNSLSEYKISNFKKYYRTFKLKELLKEI